MRGLKYFSLVVGIIAFFIVPQGASVVEAAPLTKDRVDVLQLKSITKKRRHEFTPLFSLNLNDSFVQVMTLGLGYTYHLTEGFAFELRGAYAFSNNKSLVQDMRTSGDNAMLRPGDGSTSKAKYNPALSHPQFYGFGSFLWSPLVGKFLVGNSIVDFDIFLSAGVGYIRTIEAGSGKDHVGVSFGLGWRVFLARWLSLRIDIRDTIYSQELLGSTVLTHNVFISAGFGFFFPFTPIYSVDQIP